MKSDEEIMRTFSVSLDEERHIIHLVYLEIPQDQEEDVRQAQLVYEDASRIFERDTAEKYYLLVDVTAVATWRHVAGKSREIYARLVGHKQMEKVAVYSSSMLLGVAATLIAGLSGKSESLRVFSDKKEALAWLGENE